jgi:RNA polymerase-binding transcription factor DksA
MNIDEQKQILLTHKTQLENDLDALGSRGIDGSWMVRPDEGDGSFADEVDNADIAEDFEEKIARLDVLEKQYSQVNSALAAIKSKKYGICAVCKENILEKRMKVNPSATTCVAHAR